MHRRSRTRRAATGTGPAYKCASTDLSTVTEYRLLTRRGAARVIHSRWKAMSEQQSGEQWRQWLEHLGEGSRSMLKALDPAQADSERKHAWLAARRDWLAAMQHGMHALAADLRGTDDWREAMRRRVAALAEEIGEGRSGTGEQLPPDLEWLRLWLAAAEPGSRPSLSDAMLAGLQPWPALGLPGRHLEHARALQQALNRAMDALAAYHAILGTMLTRTLEDWQEQLCQRTSDRIPDAEVLLEAWLQALTGNYERMLLSTDHRDRLAAVNVALQQAREQTLPLLEPLFRAFGLATRDDLAGTQQRMREWRREQEQEIADLRRAISELQTGKPDAESGNPD